MRGRDREGTEGEERYEEKVKINHICAKMRLTFSLM